MLDIIARTIYGMAQYESMLDQLAVGIVIRERKLQEGATWQEVCQDFPCWEEGTDSYKAIEAVHTEDTAEFYRCLSIAKCVMSHMTDADASAFFQGGAVPTHFVACDDEEETAIGTIVEPWVGQSAFLFWIEA